MHFSRTFDLGVLPLPEEISPVTNESIAGL